MIRQLLFCVLMLFTAPAYCAAGFSMNENCRSAYVNIQLLQIDQAQQKIQTEKTAHPENTAVYYLEGYIDFLTTFITEEQAAFDRQKELLDQRLHAIEKSGKDNPWAVMARAELIMQVAVNKLKWQEYIGSGYLFRKSYKMLEELHREQPQFRPALKSLGFYHAAIGAVPPQYQWLSNLAGLHGTISQGAAELDAILTICNNDKSLSYLKDEVTFLRAFVAVHFENNKSKAFDLVQLAEKSAGIGPLQQFMIANVYMLSGKPEQARNYLLAAPEVKSSLPLCYLDYLKGSLKLEVLDYTAEKDLHKYLTEFKGKSFIKAAHQKIGWIKWLNGDRKGYEAAMAAVRNSGTEITDEDKQAMVESKNTTPPNKTLLKARLLCDGGSYLEALTQIAQNNPSDYQTNREQLEVTYRLGRIYDKLGNKTKALENYSTTYQNGGSTTYYFAANAALLSGLIYEDAKDFENAKKWYANCLELKNHEYQNSIDQKAKAGYNRVAPHTSKKK